MSKKKTIDLNLYITPKMRQILEDDARYKIITKGRRSGFTHNACNSMILSALKGEHKRILWVDTTHNQIKKYIDLFILPVLRDLPKKFWHYNKSDLSIKIMDTILDFKSHENVSGIEGLSFNRIICNEIGFLFRTKDLFWNTLRPMIMDTGGDMIMGGTPKNAAGTFYEDIYNKAVSGKDPKWKAYYLSPFDNPFTDPKEIEEFILTADRKTVAQEIYGKFISISGDSFFYEFNESKHVREIYLDKSKPIHLTFDFNIGRMAALVIQKGRNYFYVIKEYALEDSDINDVCEAIKKDFNIRQISTVTGDASGKNRSGINKNVNYYTVIMKHFRLNKKSVIFPPNKLKNPYLEDSAVMCNTVLKSYPDIAIDESCESLIKDLKILKVTPEGKIDKRNNDISHWADAFRYAIHTHLTYWFEKTKLK